MRGLKNLITIKKDTQN